MTPPQDKLGESPLKPTQDPELNHVDGGPTTPAQSDVESVQQSQPQDDEYDGSGDDYREGDVRWWLPDSERVVADGDVFPWFMMVQAIVSAPSPQYPDRLMTFLCGRYYWDQPWLEKEAGPDRIKGPIGRCVNFPSASSAGK